MLYSYKCPSCGWTGDRLAKIAERDEQVCDRLLNTVTMKLDEGDSKTETTTGPCGAKLVREEVSVTAALPYQWSQWTGKA